MSYSEKSGRADHQVAQPIAQRSPARLVIVVTLLVFVSEAFVMVILSCLPPLSPLFEILFDSTLLTILLSPALYLALSRPLVLHIAEHEQAEEALQESEKSLRQAQRIAHLGSWTLDLKTNEFIVSDEMVRIYKYEDRYTGSVSMEEFAQHIHPDDRERVTVALNDAIAGTAPYDLEFRVLRTDGEVRALSAQGEVIRDERGKPTKVVGTGLDITERKRVEETLRESERKFRGVVEQSVDGIVITDEQGTIIAWNRSLEEISGLTEGEMVGKTIWDAQFQMDPEDQKTPERYQQLKAELLEFLETGSAPWMGKLLEREYTRPDGTHRFVQGVTFPIKTNEGFMLGSITRDITDRVEAEEALRESEETYRTLIETSPDAVTMINLAGQIIFASQRTLNMLGLDDVEDLVGRNALEIVAPEDQEQAARTLEEIAEQGIRRQMEYTLLRHDGTRFPAELSAAAIRDISGEPMAFVVITRDITKRKLTMEELKKYREHLEALVEERTADLRKLVNAMAGREVRMAELKKAIRQLRAQLQEAGLEPVADDPLLKDV